LGVRRLLPTPTHTQPKNERDGISGRHRMNSE
jgi:hypothetical protein